MKKIAKEIKNNLIFLILLFAIFNNKDVLASYNSNTDTSSYDMLKDIKIDKEKYSLDNKFFGKTKKTKDTEESKKQNIEKINYENYVDVYIQEWKCEGYDFEPKKVKTINLIGSIQEDGWRNVVLKNGKKFRITKSTDNCPSVILEGKDGYKQLPDGCNFTIGMYCINPNDPEATGRSFIYEATNKGWEHLNTTIMEYDNIDSE